MKLALVLLTVAHFGLSHARMNLSEGYENHPCHRDCSISSPYVCSYTFNAEWVRVREPSCERCYNTSNDCPECIKADGRRRTMMAFNRQLPGPAIHVCLGDTVRVKVCNLLSTATTSIHWHGMHQRKTQWMDGVPMITQWGIHPYTCFTYQFEATQGGTHWYHSHTGPQRADGLYGALIVHQRTDRNYQNTDLPEHTICIGDWFYESAHEQLVINDRMRTIEEDVIASILINGVGTNSTNNVPPKKFYVTQNTVHRFRLIHTGAMSCNMDFSIQGHTFAVIASDGHPFEPVEVESMQLMNGERYDILVYANKRPDLYVIRVQGSIHCLGRIGYAILQYKNARDRRFSSADYLRYVPPTGLKLNCVNEYDNNPNCIGYMDLQSTERVNPRLYEAPQFSYYVGLRISEYDRKLVRGIGDEDSFSAIANNIVMTHPDAPLLLNPGTPQKFCNYEKMNPEYCTDGVCECVHQIEIRHDVLVEFCFVDEGDLVDINHPMHLHGYQFIVSAYGKIADNVTTAEVRRRDQRGLIPRRRGGAIIKDTVIVPDGGYTCVKFISDNPGYWLMHCHVDFHMEMGMQMVVKTGIPPKAPAGFPNCASYEPPVPVQKSWWSW